VLRRHSSDRISRRWLIAWVGGSALGIVNGVFRESALKARVGEPTADRISAGSLVGLLAVFFWVLQNRWPLATQRRALEMGAAWAALTVAFEFVFGHFVDRKSWDELVSNYDVSDGKLWPFVLLWIATGPAVVWKLGEAQAVGSRTRPAKRIVPVSVSRIR
jgi:hypothetical protein